MQMFLWCSNASVRECLFCVCVCACVCSLCYRTSHFHSHPSFQYSFSSHLSSHLIPPLSLSPPLAYISSRLQRSLLPAAMGDPQHMEPPHGYPMFIPGDFQSLANDGGADDLVPFHRYVPNECCGWLSALCRLIHTMRHLYGIHYCWNCTVILGRCSEVIATAVWMILLLMEQLFTRSLPLLLLNRAKETLLTQYVYHMIATDFILSLQTVCTHVHHTHLYIQMHAHTHTHTDMMTMTLSTRPLV